MAFLLQLGQLFGILIAPNMIRLADGRGLQISLVAIGLAVALVALARRATTAPPLETGEVLPTGVIGIAQPGVLQADVMSREEDGQ